MPSTTPHWKWPFPLETENANIGATDIKELAESLDKVAVYSSGTFASLPGTVPAAGSVYQALDAPVVFFSNGTSWAAVPVAGSTPVGAIVAFAASGAITEASGAHWVPCDGTAYSRTTYAVAFERLGVAWGSGNGSTTFNVPLFEPGVGLVAVGSGFALASKGGEASVTLSTSQMPKHGHTVTDPGHVHTPEEGVFILEGVASPTRVATGGGSNWKFETATASAKTNISLAETGGGSSHNNRPPYAAVNFLLRLA